MINQLFDQFETLSTETLDFFDQNIQDKFNKLKLDLEENNIYKIHNEFNDNVWRCENLQNHSFFNINFFYITKKNKKDLNLSKYQYSLKSWAFSLLERHYNLSSIHKKIKKVKDALKESNFFDLDKLEDFKQNFFSYKLTERTKYDRASALDEYLSYTELQIDEAYMLIILETYHSNSNYKVTLRTIPSSKDTLKFSLIIEDYFNKNQSADMYLKYYPIYLWWNLTNIIPLRISEFCLIPHNCINEIDEEYFITLPRSKNKFDPTLRWDQLWIPKDLAKSILEYKVRTKDLGFSKTLLYYSTEKYGIRKKEFLTFSNEKDAYAFLYKDFSFVLDTFYSKIIKDKYGFLIAEDGDIISESEEKFMTRRIRPNDTRVSVK
ncbi:hypothetical protein [Ureibacillus chungkukjangi]|uniref:hypothetical protein n=1 Tax=Ureibacillus chungkukjangi TaxID=1202712 RepID=UPI000D38034C|nr:hypothetical protein [Ureibacillus chungkukjangi]